MKPHFPAISTQSKPSESKHPTLSQPPPKRQGGSAIGIDVAVLSVGEFDGNQRLALDGAIVPSESAERQQQAEETGP